MFHSPTKIYLRFFVFGVFVCVHLEAGVSVPTNQSAIAIHKVIDVVSRSPSMYSLWICFFPVQSLQQKTFVDDLNDGLLNAEKAAQSVGALGWL